MNRMIAAARREWQRDGVLSASTYIGLNNVGVNADILIQQFAEESTR